MCIILLDSSYKWYHMLFVFLWLTSLSMGISTTIHVAANGIIPFHFTADQYSMVYCSTSSASIPLGRFHVLTIVNNGAMNIGVRVSFWIMFFSGYMPRSGIAGSYGVLFLVVFFLINFHTVLYNGYINLHSHQEYRRVPFSSHPFHYLLFVEFFDDGHSDQCEVITQF